MLASNIAWSQEKKVRLQVAGAFPSTTGLLGPTQQYFVDTVRKMSGGSIDAVLRARRAGAGEPVFRCGRQRLARLGLDRAGFFTGKDIAFAMFSAVPFGPEAGEYLGWMNHGGGEKLMRSLHAKYNVEAMPVRLDRAGGLRLVPQGDQDASTISRA